MSLILNKSKLNSNIENITLNYNESLIIETLQGSGSATIAVSSFIPGILNETTSTLAIKTYGPYGTDVNVKIVLTNLNGSYITNKNTTPTFSTLNSLLKGGNTWVAGDSQANYINYGLIGGSPETQLTATQQSILFWYQALANGTLNIVGVSSANGTESASLVDTQMGKVQNQKKYGSLDWVWLETGTNDFYLTTHVTVDGTAANTIINVSRFLSEMAKIGVRVLLFTPPPAATTFSAALGTSVTWSQARVDQHKLYNSWFNTIAPNLFPQHIFIDQFAIGIEADGQTPLANYMLDGLHHDKTYSIATAKLVLETIGATSSGTYSRILSDKDFRGSPARTLNILAASIIGGTVGQTTLPSPWSDTLVGATNATATYKVLANPYKGAGNQIEVTVTFSAAGSFYIGFAETYAGMGAGDVWFPSAKIDIIKGAVNAAYHVPIRGSIAVTGDPFANATYFSWAGFSTVSTLPIPEDFLGLSYVGAQQVFQGGTKSTHTFLAYAQSTIAGTVTFRITEPAIWVIRAKNPAIASGFGTSPAIVSQGTGGTMRVTVGSAPGSTGVLNLSTAPTGWKLDAVNITSNAALTVEQSTPISLTGGTLTSYSRTTGLATNFNAGDVILITAQQY